MPYLRKIWSENTKEERLLGVSITGIMDNSLLCGGEGDVGHLLETLRGEVVAVNASYAEKIGIEQSTATTCVKPSGTVSQLVDSSSGIHARFSPYYIRTVRADNNDPLTKFLKSTGVPNEPCVLKPDQTTVFSFPMKSPQESRVVEELTAIDQLNHWLAFQEHWCEHKPSVTVYVKEHEWPEVGAWVWNNFDKVSGISFLPFTEHTYKQAPYTEISEEEYDSIIEQNGNLKIDWDELNKFERGDTTVGMQTLACSGDSCEIVDLT